MTNLELLLTEKQMRFLKAEADEVLFGGAAGGGKSWGQLADAFVYALRYPKSKQLILRRTYPELDKSLIRVSLDLYPREIYRYNASKHVGKFRGGSVVDFGYCDSESDVYRYQSSEYDVIRFDELTHFTEGMYLYLISRLRGANDFPKSVRSSANPGGVGHHWVKSRFLDIGEPDAVHDCGAGTRLFIPAKARDNSFLMEKDPGYLKRLRNLPEKEQRALLDGDWDIFEGQYFTEWRRDLHVCAPFPIPAEWRRYFTMDYGLDMLAGYWIAMAPEGRAYVYREVYQSGLIISRAAELILQNTREPVYCSMAPPDMWNRRQDTGKSVAELFAERGIFLSKAENGRVAGWLALREWLRPVPDERGNVTPSLQVFPCCQNLIRTMPGLLIDQNDPSDVAPEPHELTHAPDAIRYFIAGRPAPDLKLAEDDFGEQAELLMRYGRAD